MMREWLMRRLHARRTAAIRRDSAAAHLLDAERYQTQADQLRKGLKALPIGSPMRFAERIGVLAMECRADACRARAGGDMDAAAEHWLEADWYARRHRQEVVAAGGRNDRGEMVRA